jgi:hypothetical protein
MRAFFVVQLQPTFRNQSHLLQAIEHVGVEHFVAVRAIEAFDKGVLLGLAGLNEAHRDPVLITPVDEGLRPQFGPVVDPNGLRQAAEFA